MTKPVVLAADAHPGAGLGHLSRSSALACALAARGVPVRTLALGAQEAIEMDGLRWEPAASPWVADSAATVLDSYEIAEVARVELAAAGRLVEFDDAGTDIAGALAIGPLSTDANHTRRVAGPSFACLRRAVWGVRAPRPGGELRRVLVTTGGADPTGEAVSYAAGVRAALPDAVAVAWVRPDGAGEPPAGVTPVDLSPSLASEMLASDLVVCGGGLTMVEAAALGIPCVALVLVENQRPGRDRLVAAGAVAPADDLDALGLVVGRLATSPDERCNLAGRAAALVDGFGAFRVAARVADLASA